MSNYLTSTQRRERESYAPLIIISSLTLFTYSTPKVDENSIPLAPGYCTVTLFSSLIDFSLSFLFFSDMEGKTRFFFFLQNWFKINQLRKLDSDVTKIVWAKFSGFSLNRFHLLFVTKYKNLKKQNNCKENKTPKLGNITHRFLLNASYKSN